MLTTNFNLKTYCQHIFNDDFVNDVSKIDREIKTILAPIDFDTEFVDLLPKSLKSGIIKKIIDGDPLPAYNQNTEHRKLAFIQSKPVKVYKNFGLVCSPHPNYPDIPEESILLDLLNKYTVNNWEIVKLDYNRKAQHRSIKFMSYGHFLSADLAFLCTGGSIKEELHNMLASDKHFNATKRIKAGNKYHSHTSLRSHYLRCADTDEIFKIEIELVDTIGLFGNKSLKDSLIIAGLGDRVAEKDITKDLSLAYELGYLPIVDMVRFSYDRPILNSKYITNDLCVYDMLEANFKQYSIIHKDLGLPDIWLCEPKLTVGSTVARLLEQVICYKNGIDWLNDRDRLYELIKSANPKNLLERADTASLLAKVFGGLCVNNRPLDRIDIGAIVDADMDGAYATGMMLLLFALGSPEIVGFPLDNKNDYPTLREWLKMYDGELLPNAWIASIDTREYKLKYKQDYFQSWLVSSKECKHAIGDKWYKKCLEQANKKLENDDSCSVINNDKPITDFLDEGNVKILTDKIRAGILTHEGLDFILNIASEKQKKELLDNIKVTAWIVYPKSTRCKNYDDYLQKVKNHSGKREFKRTKLRKTLIERNLIDTSHTYWFGDTLGQLIIKHLVINRKRYPKDPRHPLNDYYKLLCNTIYGVLCSPYFKVSNALVGNNVTSRCRHEGWQFMKACYSNFIITDGGTFNLNRVIYPYKKTHKINGNNTVKWKGIDNKVFKLAPIDNCELIELSHEGYLIIHKIGKSIKLKHHSKLWINRVITRHIHKIFPNTWSSQFNRIKIEVKANYKTNELICVKEIPCKGYYDWEAKCFLDKITVHGASNYRLENTRTGLDKIAFRAYKDIDHYDETVFIEKFVKDGKDKNGKEKFKRETNNIAPCIEFMNNLSNYGANLPLPKLKVKTEILKLNDYQDKSDKYNAMGMTIGDSQAKIVRLLPFNKSQLLYQTEEQYYGWDRSLWNSKSKYGLSLEDFFMNENGTIDYDRMIETAYNMVSEGVINPINYLIDRHGRDVDRIAHPEREKELKIKDYFKPEENEIDW